MDNENENTETATPRDSFIKLFFRYFYEKPSALFCLLVIWFSWTLYGDNRNFIKEQQDCLKQITASITEV